MLLGFDFTGFLLIIFPPILYTLIIYFSSPYKSLSLKDSSKFLIGGIFSVIILNFFHFFFPLWNSVFISGAFYQDFFITAPKEEISKFLMFFIIYKGLYNEGKFHPITYMFYFSMIGLGFGLIENVHYVSNYGYWVLKFRIFGALFVHMICGMLFGYWIGISKIKKSKYHLRNISSLYLNSRPKIKLFIYSIFGLLSASIYHGLWNYHLSVLKGIHEPFSILLLIVGFLSCKLLSRDLINQYNDNLKS